MLNVRFYGLAKTSEGTSDSVVEANLGYKVIRDGDDWVVPENDKQLVAGPKPTLQFALKPCFLNDKKFRSVAEFYCANYLDGALENDFSNVKAPSEFIPENLGVKSNLEKLQKAFFFSKRENLAKLLAGC